MRLHTLAGGGDQTPEPAWTHISPDMLSCCSADVRLLRVHRSCVIKPSADLSVPVQRGGAVGSRGAAPSLQMYAEVACVLLSSRLVQSERRPPGQESNLTRLQCTVFIGLI